VSDENVSTESADGKTLAGDFVVMDEYNRVVDSQNLFISTFDYYKALCFWEDDEPHGLFEAVDLARGFWKGDRQWSPEAKQLLKNDNRMPVKVNRIKSALQLISGMERSNRAEIRAVPALRGDGERIVDVVNPFLKYVRKANLAEYWNSWAFENCLVTGAANFEESIGVPDGKFEEEIIRQYIPAEEVLWDMSSRLPDRSDAMYCIHWFWMSRDAFEKEYGEKPDADALERANYLESLTARQSGEDYGRRIAGGGADDVGFLPSDRMNGMEVFEKIANRSVRMVRIWRVYYKKCWKVKNTVTKQVSTWFTVEEAQQHVAASAELGHKCKMKECNEPFVCLHEIAGRKEIRFIADIGIKHIPVVSMYAFFDEHNGTFWGLPYEVKDNQEVLNQLWAVALEVIKQMPKLTLEFEEGALSPESEGELKKRGFVYGLVLKYMRGKLRTAASRVTTLEGVEKINSLQPSMQMVADDIQYQLAVRDVLQGFAPGSIKSGIGLQVLRSQGAQQLQKLFDNLTWFKLKVATIEIEMMLLIDEDFLFDVVSGNIEATWNVGENDEQVSEDDLRADVKKNWKLLLERIKYADFQYVLDQTAHNPSEMMARMDMLVEFAKGTGMQVPPELLVDSTFLSTDQKEYWKRYIKKQEQAQAAITAANGNVGAA
jgi:hypothetical protein